MTKVIGLTGSISTGKSTVLSFFREKGVPIVDADLIAREVVEPGEKTLKQIERTFGDDVLCPNGTLNRKKLAALIFEDPKKRNALNQITHPAIIERLIKQRDYWVEQEVPIVVLDIPLLYENDLEHLVDKVLVSYTRPARQLERLMARDDLTHAEAKKRINAQQPIEMKKEWADYVLNNSFERKDTKEQFERLYAELLAT